MTWHVKDWTIQKFHLHYSVIFIGLSVVEEWLVVDKCYNNLLALQISSPVPDKFTVSQPTSISAPYHIRYQRPVSSKQMYFMNPSEIFKRFAYATLVFHCIFCWNSFLEVKAPVPPNPINLDQLSLLRMLWGNNNKNINLRVQPHIWMCFKSGKGCTQNTFWSVCGWIFVNDQYHMLCQNSWLRLCNAKNSDFTFMQLFPENGFVYTIYDFHRISGSLVA